MQIPNLIFQQLVSKIIVDRARIPRALFDKAEPLVSEFRHWVGLVESFDAEQPATWIKTGVVLVEALAEPKKLNLSPIQVYLNNVGYINDASSSIDWIGEFLLENCDLKEVEEHEDTTLCSAELPNGSVAYITLHGDSFSNLFLPKKKKNRKTCYEGIQELFWSLYESVLIEATGDEFIAREYEFSDRKYLGELLGVIEDLKKFVSAGVRRVVILQGPPGTGKTTLCANAHSILSKRTMVITNSLLTQIGRNEWEMMLAIMAPSLVIIDDIDRIPPHSLEASLHLFEDTLYQVPITLLTTNNQEGMPAAFRRPGRVDMILDMPTPGPKIRKMIIEEISEREGLSKLSEEHMEFLDFLTKEKPTAFLVELLRRYKSLGWDYKIPDNDIVFKSIADDFNAGR